MPALTRRTILFGTVAAPFVIRGAAYGQTWPAGAIRIIVPYPPGGSTDVIARLVQTGLQQRLGANVIVENKAGASGSVGTELVTKTPPDGSTWLIVFDNHAANPFVLPKLPFDTEKDLDPVYWVGTAPYVVATQAQKSYRSLPDVLAAAKERPGKINYASVGTGSIGHLAMVMLANKAEIELVHVPYRGGGPALNDALAGHVELLVGSIALSMPQMALGSLRGVVQMGKTRARALGDVATMIESGYPDIVADAWWGFFAPAGTPKSIVDKIGAEVDAVLRQEQISHQLTESQQVTFVRGEPDELRRFLHEQMQAWGEVARRNGITGT